MSPKAFENALHVRFSIRIQQITSDDLRKLIQRREGLRDLNPYFHVYRGISMVWRKTAAAALLLMIIFSYYLILTNRPFIDHLKKTNNFLYALASTIIMLTLGLSIGLTWSLLSNPQGRKNGFMKEEKVKK